MVLISAGAFCISVDSVGLLISVRRERIYLVLHKINGSATIRLNGSEVDNLKSGEAACRIEVTNLLLSHNELQIEVNLPRGSHDEAAGGIVGDVQLAIYEVSP